MIRTQRALAQVIVAAHWMFAVSYLFVAARVLPSPNNSVSGMGVPLITVLHAGVAIALSMFNEKIGGVVSFAFFFAAMSADLYEQFLHASMNNIFLVASGAWTARFDSTVVVLLALEVMGCFLGILSLGTWQQNVS